MDAKKYAAEAIGTFWLTFAGCGSAVIAAAFPQVGIGLVGVSLAFGLSVVTMAYAIGHVSGCHLNPAVTVGLAAGGRFPAGQIAPYVIAQVIGAVAASALLYVIASGAAGFDVAKGFASNGYGEHSPGQYGLVACFIMEVVMTMMFLFIIMGPRQGPGGICAAGDRTCACHDSPGQHPRHQYVGQSGAQHGSGVVRGWMGAGPALAVLDCTVARRRAWRRKLPLAQRGADRHGRRSESLNADKALQPNSAR
jgi:glycerol uptake facilitator-like aquaporin